MPHPVVSDIQPRNILLFDLFQLYDHGVYSWPIAAFGPDGNLRLV